MLRSIVAVYSYKLVGVTGCAIVCSVQKWEGIARAPASEGRYITLSIPAVSSYARAVEPGFAALAGSPWHGLWRGRCS